MPSDFTHTPILWVRPAMNVSSESASSAAITVIRFLQIGQLLTFRFLRS